MFDYIIFHMLKEINLTRLNLKFLLDIHKRSTMKLGKTNKKVVIIVNRDQTHDHMVGRLKIMYFSI